MNSKRLFVAAGLIAFLQAQSVVAQQPPATTQQPEQEEVLEPAEISPGANSPQGEDFIVGEASEDSTDSEPDEEAEQGTGRFIPSEEISQDLGVSFPVDI